MGYGFYLIGDKECGYGVDAICEHDGCNTEIDRGLAYACGGEPGEHDDYCAGYFCYDHLFFSNGPDSKTRCEPCVDVINADELVSSQQL